MPAKAPERYLMLLRGINVGGQNPIAMAELTGFLEGQGFEDVSTHAQSGNAIVRSGRKPAAIGRVVEENLPAAFKLDGAGIKVLVLSRQDLWAVIDNRPPGFGDEPDAYHCDAIFLMGIDAATAMRAFSPREGVDRLWPGNGVIYSQRLSALRTKSRLNRMMASPLYKSMTIRSWGTTMKLWALMTAADR